MKKNNQGFMLVEALVMSMVIIGVLVFMYIQFQNISRSYDKSFQYNTVPGLYIANEIKAYIENNDKLEILKNDINTSKYTIVTYSDSTWTRLIGEANINTVVFADESLSALKGKRTGDFSQKMNDYINYLKVNGELNKYRLLIEFKDDTYASVRIGGE